MSFVFLQRKQDYFGPGIHAEIESGAIAHTGRDIHLPVPGLRVLPFRVIPSFVASKDRFGDAEADGPEPWDVKHRAMRVTGEEKRRGDDGLPGLPEPREEKIESVRTVKQDDIQIVVHVVERVDVLVEEHIALSLRHRMQMTTQCVDAVDAEVLVVDEDLFRMARLSQEMHVQCVLQPFSGIDEVLVLVVMVPDDTEMPESCEA